MLLNLNACLKYEENAATVTRMVDLDVNQTPTSDHRKVELPSDKQEPTLLDGNAVLRNGAEVCGSPSQPSSPCSAHILRMNPCPRGHWAAQSHVSSPHSSLGPLK